MKNFEVSAYGVEEMNARQAQELNGGIIWAWWGVRAAYLAGTAAANLVWDLAANPSETARSFKDGYNDARN